MRESARRLFRAPEKSTPLIFTWVALGIVLTGLHARLPGESVVEEKPIKVILLGAERDHPAGTHEYLAGLRVLQACLEQQPRVEVATLRVDRPAEDWSRALEGAATLVGFFYGEKVFEDTAIRQAIDRHLAQGKGLVLLHRALQGNGDAGRWIGRICGGYHGEQDRKYQTVTTRCQLHAGHPITHGTEDFTIQDEFYYQLKILPETDGLIPLVRVEIDRQLRTVGWCMKRNDGGHSFAFSGCHFHENFSRPEYRRLITQAILWSAGRSIPGEGVEVDVAEKLLAIPMSANPGTREPAAADMTAARFPKSLILPLDKVLFSIVNPFRDPEKRAHLKYAKTPIFSKLPEVDIKDLRSYHRRRSVF